MNFQEMYKTSELHRDSHKKNSVRKLMVSRSYACLFSSMLSA